MNLLLTRTSALLSLVFLSSTAMSEPKPDPGLTEVIAYVSVVSQFPNTLIEAIDQQTTGEPQLRALMRAAFADFDVNHFAARLAVPLSTSLSPAQLAPCQAFIGSTDGAALQAISKNAKSAELLDEGISKMPSAQQRATHEFFDSHCFKTVIAFIGSQEARAISRRYGMQLACFYVERTDPKMAEVSREKYGDCSKL